MGNKLPQISLRAGNHSFRMIFLKKSLYSGMELPRWHSGKESTCRCRTHKRCRFNPRVKIRGVVNGNILQYSYLGSPMNREACWAPVPGVAWLESEPTEWAHILEWCLWHTEYSTSLEWVYKWMKGWMNGKLKTPSLRLCSIDTEGLEPQML